MTHRLIRPAQSQCASSRTHTGLKLRGAGGKSKVRLAVTAKCRHPAVPCLRWGRCWSGRTTTPGELKPQLEMPRRHRRPGRDVGVRSLPGRASGLAVDVEEEAASRDKPRLRWEPSDRSQSDGYRLLQALRKESTCSILPRTVMSPMLRARTVLGQELLVRTAPLALKGKKAVGGFLGG